MWSLPTLELFEVYAAAATAAAAAAKVAVAAFASIIAVSDVTDIFSTVVAADRGTRSTAYTTLVDRGQPTAHASAVGPSNTGSRAIVRPACPRSAADAALINRS